MTTQQFRANQQRFNDDRIVASYSAVGGGLMADEEFLLNRYVPPGGRILDLGVGTGRTAAGLAARAHTYVAIDYAPEMVAEARRRHPDLDIRVGDATNLDGIEDASFDAVVFSYNGLDYLHPDAARDLALREIRRVLAPGGVVLLSRHNPRSVLARPAGRGALARRLAAAAYSSARRARRLVPTGAFWQGEGYVREPFHGGLMGHMATRRRVVAELEAYGFRHLHTVGAHARRRTAGAWTPWYSYAFVATPRF